MKYTPRLHIVMHQPEIPYNAGNIGRTCVAVAAKLWMTRPLGFETTDYYLRRAGLDYWDHLEWEVVDDWAAILQQLGTERRYWFFTKTGSTLYTDVQYHEGDVLVFGNESSGLPAAILDEHRDRALRVPTRPQIRSLNLANTAAVAMYEAVRQWDMGDKL